MISGIKIVQIGSGLAGATIAAAAVAQQPYTFSLPLMPTELATYATSAEVAAIVKHAAAQMKPNQPVIVQPIQQYGSYTSFIEVRRGTWTAATHPDIELFYVVRGTGSLVMGGTIPDARIGKGGNAAGSKIEGGRTMRVAAGDLFFVPPGTAHQFPAPESELVLISMHIPLAAPPTKP